MKAILLGGAAFSLLTAAAFGADLELPPAPPPFTWTSCYGGGQVGGAWGQNSATDSAGVLSPITGFTAASVGSSGYMVGGQVGCDYQFAPNWVLGIEGAVSGGSIKGSTAVALPAGIPGDSATFSETTDLLTSATGRVGYAWDRWLLYAKGGAAWASDKYSVVGAFLGMPNDLQGLETRFGWTAGAGVEWALWNNWSVKLEYDYYGFGTRSVTFIDPINGNVGPEDIKQSIQVVKLGVNLRIPAWSAAAPSKW